MLAVPFTNPSNSEAMAWQAVRGMHFRLIGGYATLSTRQALRSTSAPFFHRVTCRSCSAIRNSVTCFHMYLHRRRRDELLTYFTRYSVGAVVFRSRGAITSLNYWFLINSLGQPQVVEPGYAIWIPEGGAWKAPAPDTDYVTNTSITPDQEREHVF